MEGKIKNIQSDLSCVNREFKHTLLINFNILELQVGF